MPMPILPCAMQDSDKTINTGKINNFLMPYLYILSCKVQYVLNKTKHSVLKRLLSDGMGCFDIAVQRRGAYTIIPDPKATCAGGIPSEISYYFLV